MRSFQPEHETERRRYYGRESRDGGGSGRSTEMSLYNPSVYGDRQLCRAVLDDRLRVHDRSGADPGAPLRTEQFAVRSGAVQQRHHARVGGRVRRVLRTSRQQAAPDLRHDGAGGTRQPAHVSAAFRLQLRRSSNARSRLYVMMMCCPRICCHTFSASRFCPSVCLSHSCTLVIHS